MNTQLITDIIQSFYAKAKDDIIIGFHFRNIEDFHTHIPHIVNFWEVQLLGKHFPKHLPKHLDEKPFDIINKHIALQFNQGQLDRWVKLFIDNMNEFEIQSSDKEIWIEKINFFKQKLVSIPGMIRN